MWGRWAGASRSPGAATVNETGTTPRETNALARTGPAGCHRAAFRPFFFFREGAVMNSGTDRGTWRHDLLASVVVFLVALPLCMGIAIASGVPPEKAAAVGVITGIIGGIVVGLLAGSPLLITGPAAGLSVLVFELVQRFGWERVGLIVLIAGGLQVGAGVLKLGQWFRAVSPAVIHGMLAGIGVLIFASQFHIMLDDAPHGSGIQNVLSIPEAAAKGLWPRDGQHHAGWIGVVTILVLILWKSFVPKRLKIVPAPLVAVVVATLF